MAAAALLAAVAAALGIGVAPIPGEHLAVDEPQYWFTALSLAEDGDVDIADELAERRWEQFTDQEPPVETVRLAGGRQISPHDPLLPLLLAVPVAAGGWVGAKLAMALSAGALAALTVWTAVRRFAVPLPLAAIGVGIAATSAPLAVYGQQLYPELPAALVCLSGIAALTGPPRRMQLLLSAAAVVALPWLSVKYTPVAAALAGLTVWRWWRAGQRREVFFLGVGLAGLGVVYLAVHRVVWGGWTAYASGDHFQDIGEFAVIGVDPDYPERSWRLVGLLVDRDFGLAAWQPAWLLVVPALAALLACPPRGGLTTASQGGSATAGQGGSATADRHGFATTALAVPLLAGWLVACFLALTMHGWWWPGRQTVVVLPLALLVILCWLTRSGTVLRTVAAVLGVAGVSTYAALLLDGWVGNMVWVAYTHPTGYSEVNAPLYQALRPLLPAFRDYSGHVIWTVLLVSAAAAAWRCALHDPVLPLPFDPCDDGTVTDVPTVTFRPPLTGLIAVFGLAVCVTPVAFGAPGLQALYLLPLGVLVWLIRTRTVAGPDKVVARRVLGTRTVSWSQLEGLRVDQRSRVWAVLRDGAEIGLPAVRPRDLPMLAKASQGRLSDPLAHRDPANRDWARLAIDSTGDRPE